MSFWFLFAVLYITNILMNLVYMLYIIKLVYLQELVQYFLEHGADIDSINSMNCTPFIAAVGAKQKEIAEVHHSISLLKSRLKNWYFMHVIVISFVTSIVNIMPADLSLPKFLHFQYFSFSYWLNGELTFTRKTTLEKLRLILSIMKVLYQIY